jgi:hypothetical protein
MEPLLKLRATFRPYPQKNGRPLQGGRLESLKSGFDLLDVGTHDGGHLHHVDGLAFSKNVED